MSSLMPQTMTSMSAKRSESTEDGLSAAAGAALLLLLLLVLEGGGPKGGGPPKGWLVLEDIAVLWLCLLVLVLAWMDLEDQGEAREAEGKVNLSDHTSWKA